MDLTDVRMYMYRKQHLRVIHHHMLTLLLLKTLLDDYDHKALYSHPARFQVCSPVIASMECDTDLRSYKNCALPMADQRVLQF